MTKRALLIGSPVGGLSGIDTDVRNMEEVLEPYEFEVRHCVGRLATRHGILDAYRQLIDDTSAGDAAVVYFSGHGARGAAASNEMAADSNQGPITTYHQFIVPVDLHESTNDDFRGITALELSVLMARLTDKTKNVTVILDCCHSARMSRGLQITSRALPRTWFLGVASHLERLEREGIDVTRLDVESNPHAVRLVAASPSQSAYEYLNSAGNFTGMLTESLSIALNEAQGLPVTWAALGKRVRDRVLSLEHTQRPEVEGPTDRLLFDVETVEQTGTLGVSITNGVPFLNGGRILGVEVDDQYSILPLNQTKLDSDKEIARATVTDVSGGSARIAVEFRDGHRTIPDGAQAFPIRRALHKLSIRIRGGEERTAALRESLKEDGHLRLFSEDDPADVLATIDVSDQEISLLDSEDRSMVSPKPYSEASIGETRRNLQQFARAYHLRTLSDGEGPSRLRQECAVEWGIVKEGQRSEIPAVGSLLHVGDPVFVRVHNKSGQNLYASIFDVGLSSKIGLLSNSEPSGIEIRPGDDFILGYREDVGMKGLPLGWSDAAPSDGPRPESIVVIVSDRPQDLRAFRQSGMRGMADAKSAAGAAASDLQQLLEQFETGGTRDLNPESDLAAPQVRYAVRHIDFLVDPNQGPAVGEGQFLIDERPAIGFFARSRRGTGSPPDNVAVRLKEAIVHRNRALFGTAVRVDSMVITGAGQVADCYRAATARFPDVKDGDRLSFDNLLVYHGPARGFLDIAVWISRDQQDSLDLSELFKQQMNSDEFKDAALVLAGLAVAAPHAAAIVAAAGAAATLTNIGYKLLSQAVGKSIGLYRTSFLGHESFGLGSHPAHGLKRVQDFSFGYEIIEV